MDTPLKVKTAPATEPTSAGLRLEAFLPYRLNVLASIVSQALSQIYAERYRIGVPEWRILVTLGECGVMTGKALGAHTHMHKAKVSRAVALLVERDRVARRANSEDRREALLSLTPSGRRVYDELAPAALAFARRLEEALDQPTREALDRAVTDLTARARALAGDNDDSGVRR